MPLDTSISDPVPRRLDLLGDAVADNGKLATSLEMNLPGGLEKAPPTLAFDRVREVSLPWAQLVEQMSHNPDGAMSPMAPLRFYFERSWWGKECDKPSADNLRKLAEDGLVIILPIPADAPTTGPAGFFEYGEVAGEKDTRVVKGTPVEKGVILRHGVSGRYYLIETTDPAAAATSEAEPAADPNADILTQEGYLDFWAKRADAATVVFASEAELENSQTKFEELDLRAIYIERRYRELKIMQEIVQKTSATAVKTLDSILESSVGPDLNFEAIDAVQSRYVSIRLGPSRIRRNLLQLKRQAAQMGYLLFLGDEPGMKKNEQKSADLQIPVYEMTVTFPDNEKRTVAAGELYTTFKRTCTYTVTHKKSIVRNIGEGIAYGFRRLFGGSDEKPKTTYKETKAKVVKDYTKVDTLTDPLSKRVMAYRAEEREVHVFTETPSGYVTDDGISLADVMVRCEFDEAYRRNCVVMLPVFEQGFAVERPVVAYSIFERPLPGILPSRLPRLFIEESLTYRTAWTGNELGELVRAINLAPGEEREITITSSFQEERSVSETRTSVTELNSTETSDIATEMEAIARNESEFSAHAEGSQEASIGGPLFGAVSGSASSRFSYGASDTLKTFNQSMNKVAKKAATSISKKNQLEVSTSSSVTTTVSTTDSTIIKMSNINKGRTLNLMFYRVYNRFATGLFIENLSFGVVSGVEMIAGSGVYETRSFRPERIGEMLNMFKRTPLPFNTSPEAVAQYQNTILDTVLGQLRIEYLVEEEVVEEEKEGTGRKSAGKSEEKEKAVQSTFQAPQKDTLGGSSNVVKISRDLLDTVFGKAAESRENKNDVKKIAMDQNALRARLKKVEDGLKKIELESVPMGDGGGASDLLIASGGLYLDSLVGSRPSTEPYSEEMRTQEIRKSAVEVLKSEAEAQFSLAQARRIAQMPVGSNPAGNVLTGVHVVEERGLQLLTLGFLLPLPSGKWTVCVDGEPVPDGEIPADQLQRTSVVLKLTRMPRNRKPEWASAPDLMRRVTVRDLDTEDEIAPL